jgi:8-oxo-dGTP diphosphatase
MKDEKLHYVAVTGIVVKDGKYLIARRGLDQAAFPGLWTVPGGKLRKSDYLNSSKDTPDSWYNVLEKLLQREIKEEVGLEVKDLHYLTSLVYIRSDGIPTIVISLYCTYGSGKVRLSDELTEYVWVSVNQLERYELISGIREEIEMVDEALKKGQRRVWTGKHSNPLGESLRNGA